MRKTVGGTYASMPPMRCNNVKFGFGTAVSVTVYVVRARWNVRRSRSPAYGARRREAVS